MCSSDLYRIERWPQVTADGRNDFNCVIDLYLQPGDANVFLFFFLPFHYLNIYFSIRYSKLTDGRVRGPVKDNTACRQLQLSGIDPSTLIVFDEITLVRVYG